MTFRNKALWFGLPCLIVIAVAAIVGYRGLYFSGDDPSQFFTGYLQLGPTMPPILIGIDGDHILIDLDGNKRFGKGERFTTHINGLAKVSISDPANATTYQFIEGYFHRDDQTQPTFLDLHLRVVGSTAYEISCHWPMTKHGTAIAHVQGPYEFGFNQQGPKVPDNFRFVICQNPTELKVEIGKFDTANDTYVALMTCRSIEGRPPTELHKLSEEFRPTADIEFPTKVAGGPTIRQKYTLDSVC